MAFQFSRGLSPHFVERLNEKYEQGGWWKDIADNRSVFVAIRANYLNVYWKGNSLLKLMLDGDGRLVGEVHYKYLLKCDAERQYVSVDDSGRAINLPAAGLFLDGVANIEDVKRAAAPYGGDEKDGVHAILLKNSGVIDVEVAFGTNATEAENASAPRIDFAALHTGSDIAKIVFYEAKLFSNKEVRARGKAPPPVTSQIKTYEGLLTKHSEDVIRSYRRVCDNLSKLSGLAARYPKDTLKKMRQISSGEAELSMDPAVQLIIFDFDRDQGRGEVWGVHHKKLKDCLRERLHLIGNAQGFRL